MNKFFQHGESVAYRGLIFGRVRSAKSVIVERDMVDESVLLLLPGAQCAFPEWYMHKNDDEDPQHKSRWTEALGKQWNFQTVAWRVNRFLIVTHPTKFYSVYLVWDHATDRFVCYYVNFQLPLTRSQCGFDTFDLELDIQVDPNGKWTLKDEAAYKEGIRTGIIQRSWADAVEKEREIVISAIEKRSYPFDDFWRDYAVDRLWEPPNLPQGWDKI